MNIPRHTIEIDTVFVTLLFLQNKTTGMKPPKSTREDVFVQYKLWLQSITGEGIIGEGKIKLLQKVSELGSLSAAAESVGISYRKAWEDIRKAERLLGYPLTEKHRGGRDGGKSILTPQAEKLLDAYGALKKDFSRNLDEVVETFKRRISE